MLQRAKQAAMTAPRSPLDRTMFSLHDSHYGAALEAPQTIALVKSLWAALCFYVALLSVIIALYYLLRSHGTKLVQFYNYWQQYDHGREHVTYPIYKETYRPGSSETACRDCETIHMRTRRHVVCIVCQLPHSLDARCDSRPPRTSSDQTRKEQEHIQEINQLRQTIAEKAKDIKDLKIELEEQRHIVEGLETNAPTTQTRHLELHLKSLESQLAQYKEKEKSMESLKRDYDMERLHVNEVFRKMREESPLLSQRYSAPTHAGCFIKLAEDERVDGKLLEGTPSNSRQSSKTSQAEIYYWKDGMRREEMFCWLQRIANRLGTMATCPDIEERVIELTNRPLPTQPTNIRDSRAGIAFQGCDDTSLKKDFMQLHMAVKTLAFHVKDFVHFDDQMRALCEISPLIKNTTILHFRKHKLFVIEGAIWSFLLKTVFANPLEMFGSRGKHLAEEWAAPSTQACAELWRWSTVHALLRSAGLSRDQLTGPSAVDALRYIVKNKLALDRKFPADVIKYTDSIKSADPKSRKSLLDAQTALFQRLQETVHALGVGLGKAEKEIETVTIRAHDLAVKLASQLPRFELVFPSVGTIVDDITTRGDHPLHEKIPACESIRIGHVVFTSRPSLRKWGNQNGDRLNESLDLEPSQVCLEEAEDLLRKTYEPRPKMPPREEQYFLNGAFTPRLFKPIKRVASQPPPAPAKNNNSANFKSTAPGPSSSKPVNTTNNNNTSKSAKSDNTNEDQNRLAFKTFIKQLRTDIQDPTRYITIPTFNVFYAILRPALFQFTDLSTQTPLLRATDYKALLSIVDGGLRKLRSIEIPNDETRQRDILSSLLLTFAVDLSGHMQQIGEAALAAPDTHYSPLITFAIQYHCVLDPQIVTIHTRLTPQSTVASSVMEEAQRLYNAVLALGDDIDAFKCSGLEERDEKNHLLTAMMEGVRVLVEHVQEVEAAQRSGTVGGDNAGQGGEEGGGGEGGIGSGDTQATVQSQSNDDLYEL